MKEQIKSNLSFFAVTLCIIALVAGLASLEEKLLERKTGKKISGWDAKKIATTGLLSALGGVLMLLEINIPLIPMFYQLDLSEVAGIMAGFLLGPVASVVVEFIKVVIHVILHGTHSAFVGEFASFVLGCIFILPASYFYHAHKNKKNAVISLIIGSICLILFGALFNAYYLIPKFADIYGIGLDGILSMAQGVNPSITSVTKLILYATVPFNVVKSLVVSVIILLIYKPISNLYRKV